MKSSPQSAKRSQFGFQTLSASDNIKYRLAWTDMGEFSRRSILIAGTAVPAIVLIRSFGGRAAASPFKLGLFTEATGASIPADQDVVMTSGHGRVGLGAATYHFDSAVTAAQRAAYPNAIFVAADGRPFRLQGNRPELAMFGGRPDWRGSLNSSGDVITRSGTNNATTIQRALGYLQDFGGGTLEIAGSYGFDCPVGIIIPENVSIAGNGPEESKLVLTGKRLAPVFLWGTYGPAIRTQITPVAETRFDIENAPSGSLQIRLRNRNDAFAFHAGMIVYIEGMREKTHGNLTTPNLLRRITGVNPSDGSIALAQPLDDNYRSSALGSAGVRRLNMGTLPSTDQYTTDVTGRKWPLFVATRTSITDIAFVQGRGIGWPTLYTSAFDFTVDNVVMEGTYYWGMDPATNGRVTNTRWTFSNRALEAAYGSSDVVFADCAASRMAGGKAQDNAPLVWTNPAEGGKSLVFERFILKDPANKRIGDGHGTNVAFGLVNSQLIDSASTAPAGGIGFFIGQSSVVRGSQFVANRTSHQAGISFPSAMIRDGLFEHNIVNAAGAGDASIVVMGNGQVLNNEIGPSGRKSPADRVIRGKGPGNPAISGNQTGE
ncbi:hypothetical protein [Stakelama marina]|uniref:Uncharacterized protein n=1 Tax=Stakelama marina TaxID=2826939 RepID=A0A8T4IGA3_9SPHN|nr:hypothetical protein [Stakelama marina]MBR0552105.1 hypothetical protein [Stakelama marina]